MKLLGPGSLTFVVMARNATVEFHSNTAQDERERLYKMSGKIVRTFNVTQSAEGDKDGMWTSVVAMAVLLP
jgi:arginine decarboxylase